MRESAPLDPVILGELRDLARNGAPNLLHDVYGVFTEDTSHELASLRAAAAAGDAGALGAIAHKLKGSAATVGATAMADVCRRIEDAATADDLGDVERLLAELETQAANVTAALARAVDDGISDTKT
jgi:hypothetical protein